MADFDLIISGASVVAWTDNETPSRLNPRSGGTMLRYLAHVGDTVTMTASVAGSSGHEYFPHAWERPASSPPYAFTAGSGTHIQSFVPVATGHYLIGMRHVDGGSVFFHLDVEAPP
jgi:hypothetical protein